MAALLAIANAGEGGEEEEQYDGDDGDGGDDGGLDRYVLWREMKKVVKALREELEQEKGEGRVLAFSDKDCLTRFSYLY